MVEFLILITFILPTKALGCMNLHVACFSNDGRKQENIYCKNKNAKEVHKRVCIVHNI